MYVNLRIYSPKSIKMSYLENTTFFKHRAVLYETEPVYELAQFSSFVICPVVYLSHFFSLFRFAGSKLCEIFQRQRNTGTGR